ncbi:MAG: DUF2236 domain-containing protein [Flavobacteriaceae bacterium]|nr:DUF2236 domain-containing protein [Flavobacteriaceae bacterium]
MQYFVHKESIVKKIWGKSDTILFIFAGASAEFALNKAVDWLYFTGKLPADPIGRLFSTVRYARMIVFAPMKAANDAIDTMRQIHEGVELKRGDAIPDWAYRDVLFMLIYYSIAAHELLEKKLSDAEKEEVYNVFYRVGDRMGVKDLPATYLEWLPVRHSHLEADLKNSAFTIDLFEQYRKHLGNLRYKVLIEAQKLVIPKKVSVLLDFNSMHWLKPIVPMYKLSKRLQLDGLVKTILLPNAYKQQIKELDVYDLSDQTASSLPVGSRK